MFLINGSKASWGGDRNGPWPRAYIEKGEPNPRVSDTFFASVPPQSAASCVFLVCFRCAISVVILAVSGTSMVLAGKIPFQGLKCLRNEIIRLVRLYDATLIWSISACSYRRNINSDRQSGF